MKREHRRYVVFAVASGTRRIELEKILNSGTRQGGFRIIQYEESTGKGIFRCQHTALERVRSLANKHGAGFRILGVSGTIKRARKKFFNQGAVR